MSNEQQQNHASNLKAAQASSLKNSARSARKQFKSATNTASLMAHINPFMDWLFGIAIIFAIIKDILDLASTALIAIGGVGVALLFITTTICFLFIFFIMLLTGSSSKNKAMKGLAKRFGTLALTTLVEFIPGIDVLPLETIGVVTIFWMTLTERKIAAEKERLENAASISVNNVATA